MEGRFFENFQKNQKLFKITKMPKIVPKSVQTCFEHVLGYFFRKFCFAQCCMRVDSSEIFKKIKKFSSLQKCPKSFPKVSKRVLNMFWVNFFEFFFAQCSMEGRFFGNFKKNQKLFKITKMPKIVPKSVQTCFEHVLGHFFSKNLFCPVLHEGRFFGNFQKNQKVFKIPKKPKIVPKNVQTCFDYVLG